MLAYSLTDFQAEYILRKRRNINGFIMINIYARTNLKQCLFNTDLVMLSNAIYIIT